MAEETHDIDNVRSGGAAVSLRHLGPQGNPAYVSKILPTLADDVDPSMDQATEDVEVDFELATPEQLLAQLAELGVNSPPRLICEIELARFDEGQDQTLMPLLWQYILHHRDSDDFQTIVAVGSAIRYYVGERDASRLGEVTDLLEPGASPVIELEVAKMVFRKFHANPPTERNPQPRLAERFTQMIIAYLDPRVLPWEQFAAVTMLAIQAIALMRGPSSRTIIEALNQSPFGWFRQQLHGRLSNTLDSWRQRNVNAETIADLSLFLGQIRLN